VASVILFVCVSLLVRTLIENGLSYRHQARYTYRLLHGGGSEVKRSNITSHGYGYNKKLCRCRGTARRATNTNYRIWKACNRWM